MDPWSKDSTLITQSQLRPQTNKKTEKPESDNDDDDDDDDDEALDISILSTLSQQTPLNQPITGGVFIHYYQS